MPAELLSGFLRHDRAIALGALAAVIAAAWAYLLLGAGIEMDMMDMGGGQLMAMLPEWSLRYAGLIVIMWAVMMAAMMLPSAAPTILLVGALFRNRGGAVPGRTALFASGYLVVWCGFSVAATLLQWGLAEAGLLSETMALGNAIVASVVLIAAGVYQWTPLKTPVSPTAGRPPSSLSGTGAPGHSAASGPACATGSSASAAVGC